MSAGCCAVLGDRPHLYHRHRPHLFRSKLLQNSLEDVDDVFGVCVVNVLNQHIAQRDIDLPPEVVPGRVRVKQLASKKYSPFGRTQRGSDSPGCCADDLDYSPSANPQRQSGPPDHWQTSTDPGIRFGNDH